MHRRDKWITQAALLFFLILWTSIPHAVAAVPESPSGLTPVAGNGEVSLIWDAVIGATDYLVYRGTGSGGPYGFVAETQGTGYSDRNLTNNVSHYYVLTALNADGQSAYTTPVEVTPTADVLPAPTGVRTISGSGEISILWNPVTSAVSYSVYRATSKGGPYTLLAPTAPGPSYTDRGLANGTEYSYVIQTMSTNAGAYSNESSATPSQLLPVSPTTFAVAPGSTWAGLSWNPSAGAAAYVLYRSTTLGGPYMFLSQPNTTTYEDTGLINGTRYYYAVAALNATNRGAFSLEANALIALTEKPHATVITATGGDGAAYLSWKSSPGAVSYKVYRSTNAGGPYDSLGVQGPGYSDTSVINGTIYYYVVDAHNASTTVARSNEASITPGARLPAPSNIIVKPGNTEATITWNPVASATNYYVILATSPGGDPISGGGTTNLRPYFTATGLTNEETYYFRIQAGSYPWSADSGNVSVTPSAALPPAPANVHVYPGNASLSLTWSTVTGATSYKVFRREKEKAWSSTPVGSSTATLFTDSGLTNGTTYYYVVAAVNGSGTGAYSRKEVNGTPTAIALPAPVSVAGTPGDTQATITWDPVVGANNFYVTVAGTPGGRAISGGGTTNLRPSFTAKGLTNGTAYYFRIQTSSSVWSAFSAEVDIAPSVDLPLAPSNLRVHPGNTELSVTWSAVDDATRYDIYRRAANEEWSSAPVATTTGTLFTDSGLTNATRYYYSLAAGNANGEGAWSDEVNGIPTGDAVTAPTNIAVTPGNTQATVSWDPVAGSSSYYVTVSTTPGGQAIGSSGSTDGTHFVATNLENDRMHYFRVQAVSIVWSAYSEEAGTTPNPSAENGNITGRISADIAGHTGLGVTNATVSLQGTSSSTTPDENGNFALLNVPMDDYTLIVSAPNMETITQNVSLSSQNLQLSIPPMTVSEASGPVGDANGDGQVGLADAVFILQLVIGIR